MIISSLLLYTGIGSIRELWSNIYSLTGCNLTQEWGERIAHLIDKQPAVPLTYLSLWPLLDRISYTKDPSCVFGKNNLCV